MSTSCLNHGLLRLKDYKDYDTDRKSVKSINAINP
jgi:hypothetical protein